MYPKKKNVFGKQHTLDMLCSESLHFCYNAQCTQNSGRHSDLFNFKQHLF